MWRSIDSAHLRESIEFPENHANVPRQWMSFFRLHFHQLQEHRMCIENYYFSKSFYRGNAHPLIDKPVQYEVLNRSGKYINTQSKSSQFWLDLSYFGSSFAVFHHIGTFARFPGNSLDSGRCAESTDLGIRYKPFHESYYKFELVRKLWTAKVISEKTQQSD